MTILNTNEEQSLYLFNLCLLMVLCQYEALYKNTNYSWLLYSHVEYSIYCTSVRRN